MMNQDDMEVLDKLHKMKSKKSFKEVVNGRNLDENELDACMTE